MFYYRDLNDKGLPFVACYDWTKIKNVRIAFDELAVNEDEKNYYLYLRVQKFLGIKKSKDDNWALPLNTKLVLPVAKSDYKQRDYKKGEDVDVPQSKLQKVLCRMIETRLNLSKAYSGMLELDNSPRLDDILSGQDAFTGKSLDAMDYDFFYRTLLTTTEEWSIDKLKYFTVEELTTFPNLESNKGGGKGSGSFNPAPTQSEKLDDAVGWFVKQTNVVFPQAQVQTIYDLSPVGITKLHGISDNVKAEIQSTFETFLALVQALN